MAIKTNVKDTRPSRERFKQEITLLSHGHAAPTAWPDGKITVYPWDHEIDEWIAKHGDKEKDTDFLWKLTERLCNLNGEPIESMIVGDAWTILLVARAIRHQNVVSYVPVCGHCGQKNKEEVIRVPDQLDRVAEKNPGYPGYDIITTPVEKDQVAIRPLTVQDMKMIDARGDEARKNLPDNVLAVLASIVNIGGGTPDSADELTQWWHSLHPQDRDFLIQATDRLSPHLDPEIKHQCDFCHKEFKFRLPIDAKEFFRQGG